MVCNGKLTGIMSHSMDRGCYTGGAQAYTNINHYIDWIKTAAAPTTPKPPTTTTETTENQQPRKNQQQPPRNPQ